MQLPTTDARNNLNEFLDRHGKKGILVLYFSNLLEEIVRGEYLHTITKESSTSPGIREYSGDSNDLASREILDQRSLELHQACVLRATKVVEGLCDRGLLEDFERQASMNSAVAHEVNIALKAIFREVFNVNWGNER